MLSSRVRPGARNRLAHAVERRRAAGLAIADLTESNPTRAGFAYPADLLVPLGHARGLCYEPAPFGLPSARQAVSDDYARRGVTVAPERVALTASTSDAYSMLFKLLCDPGDSVLVPRPSYPLVEHLADLDGVRVVSYSLDCHGRWALDLAAIAEALGDPAARVRAVVAINPNNPTGSAVQPSELAQLAALARQYDVALISDEVFADYAHDAAAAPRSFLSQAEALTFGLGGLSKTVGLPQVKLGWIGVSGPGEVVDRAMERLETIGDTYLSVSTPVQAAAAELLANGAAVRIQIQRRVIANYRCLRDASASNPSCDVLPVDAGWYAVVQVPAVASEETLAIGLLERAGVLVHPGYFFDFEREAYLVVSLLPAPDVFAAAVERLFADVGCAA